MDLLDGIDSLRSVRRFSPERIEPRKIKKILRAATMAASSSNSQPWHFVVVTKEQVKIDLGEIFLKTWLSHVQSLAINARSNRIRLIYKESTSMLRHTRAIPLLIIACLDMDKASRIPEAMYASIYPAVQNLMLAAWSLGIGSCLTTNGTSKLRGEVKSRELLGIPANVKIAATIYLGYPKGELSLPNRQLVEKVIHREKW